MPAELHNTNPTREFREKHVIFSQQPAREDKVGFSRGEFDTRERARKTADSEGRRASRGRAETLKRKFERKQQRKKEKQHDNGEIIRSV